MRWPAHIRDILLSTITTQDTVLNGKWETTECGFNGQRMQQLIEGIWNKVDYDFKYSRKAAGQLEECCDSKGMQSVLNGSEVG